MAAENFETGRAAKAYLMRNQGPELFNTFTVAAPTGGTTTVIQKSVNLSRPLEAMMVQIKMRVVIGTANYTAVAAEAPQTWLNRVTIYGTFKNSAQTPWNISGATLLAWVRLFGYRGSSIYINGTRQAELSVPLQQVGATFGNTGTYDIEMNFFLPTWVMCATSRRSNEQYFYYWQAKDWNDTLQVTIVTGDDTSFGTKAGGTTVVYTAYASATSSPAVNVMTRYVIMGPLREGFNTALVMRGESQYSANMTAAATAVQIATLARQKTTNVVFKSGTILAGTSSGIQVYATLSDLQLDATQILVDNRALRNNWSNTISKESMGLQFNTVLPGGYLYFSFVDTQTPRSALRADLPSVVGAGTNFVLNTNVLTAGATQSVGVIQEQIIAEPGDEYWNGTR